MGRSFGSRTLVTICGVLVVLLAALAAVQYRWSARVAAADAQREKEHLDSAAALFANRFNDLAVQAMHFLQNDAHAAVKSGERLTGIPKLFGEVYYLNSPKNGAREVKKLTAQGFFAPSSLPPWIAVPRCAALVTGEPPALLVPLYDFETTEIRGAGGIRVMRTFRSRTDRCFVARIDQSYLRDALFPQLIHRSFGETSAREYDFAVISLGPPDRALYGAPLHADLRKPFFSMRAGAVALPGGLPPATGNLGTENRKPGPAVRPVPIPVPEQSAVLIQRVDAFFRRGIPGLHGSGTWELEIAHKGVPLAAAFEQARRRDLLLSLGVELLLLAAIGFLVIGARRMQRLADQKMRFVAGVSHELRTPVSAITMLSRNQADGLVAGVEKVKQYGELIHQQSRRLSEMIEQALQYAGIHSGLRRPVKDEVDLRSLIHEALDARREELARGGFEVETGLSSDLPRVPGDAKLLRTAFDNLLDNTLKYAGGGRWIRVAARYAAPEKEVRIEVEDRGAGIRPADQAEIFEPFCRGRAAEEAQIPGSGLGLSLVRSAAEVHGGSVTLVSEPGRGSTFTIHLPV